MRKRIGLAVLWMGFMFQGSAEVIDRWGMNDRGGVWQHSDQGLNLGAHYHGERQQFPQVSQNGEFIFAPLQAQNYGGKLPLSRDVILDRGVVRVSVHFTKFDFSGTPDNRTVWGFRLWNSSGEVKVASIEVIQGNGVVQARAGGLAGNMMGGTWGQGLTMKTAGNYGVYLDIDKAAGEIRMGTLDDGWHGISSEEVVGSADFSGVENASHFQCSYAAWGAGDQITISEIMVEQFFEPAPGGAVGSVGFDGQSGRWLCWK